MCQKQLNIRVPAHELKILNRYAKQTKRTKTDILREFIRSLNKQHHFQYNENINKYKIQD